MSNKWENVVGSITTEESRQQDQTVLEKHFYIAVLVDGEWFYAKSVVPLSETEAHPDRVLMLLTQMVEHIEERITEKELHSDTDH